MKSVRIGGGTKLVGLIGYPLHHSLSPAMHNAAFAEMGLDWCYLPLPVKPNSLSEAVAGLRALGFQGANVTIPYKERVMEFLDTNSEAAQAIGAVNTILVRGEKLCGHNTDWMGFLRALREGGFEPSEKTALVLGAGGAARAVVYALAREGARVVVLNRTPERAQALVQALSSFTDASLEAFPLSEVTLAREVRDVQLLVNATPVGMYPETEHSPVPEGLPLPSSLTVFDLVYNPLKTSLVKQAEARGLRTLGGLGMLVHQGGEAFRLWTGQEAPVEVMRQAILAQLVS